MLHFAVLGALLPALAHLTAPATDPQQAQLAARVFRRSWVFLLSISVLVALLVMAFAEPLVTWLFGAAYLPSVALVKILAVSLVPYTISAAWSVRLVAQGQERRVMWALAMSLAVAFILDCWLIPVYGSGGAALAVAISEGVFAAALLMWEALMLDLPEHAPEDEPIFTAVICWRSVGAGAARRKSRRRTQSSSAINVAAIAALLKRYRHTRVAGFFGDLHLLKTRGQPIGVLQPAGPGAPLAAAALEELIAFGVQRFVSIGLAGGLSVRSAFRRCRHCRSRATR